MTVIFFLNDCQTEKIWLLTPTSLPTETSSEWQQRGRKCLINDRSQNWVGDHRMATETQMLHPALTRRNYCKNWPVCLICCFQGGMNAREQLHLGFDFQHKLNTASGEGGIDDLPPVAGWWWHCEGRSEGPTTCALGGRRSGGPFALAAAFVCRIWRASGPHSAPLCVFPAGGIWGTSNRWGFHLHSRRRRGLKFASAGPARSLLEDAT